MSYQDYAQFGRGRRRDTADNKPPLTRQPRGNGSAERPYTGSTASFSIPRASTHHSNSPSTSTTTSSISPSNSASQQDASLSPMPGPPLHATNSNTSNKSLSRQATWVDNPQLKGLELGTAEKPPNLVEAPPLPWRPFYLQRRILAAFVGIFAGLIVALEALGDFSGRNEGLTGNVGEGEGAEMGRATTTAMRYAWAYVPAALLTILAGLWSRVEHQAKSAAPWVRLSKGPAPAERTLLLDYVGMARPVALVKAITNRDAVVACAVAVSLLLRALIVLSTALVTITLVGGESSQAVPVMLRTAFTHDADGLAETGALSFYAMFGLQQENTSLPDGVSSRFAYQQFSTDGLPTSTAVDVLVEGFSAALDCEAARLGVTGVQYDEPEVRFDAALDVPGCSIAMSIRSKVFLEGDDDQRGTAGPRYFARFGSSACGGSTAIEEQRVVVIFGTETVDPETLPTAPVQSSVPVTGAITQSAQLICKPTYTMSDMNARKNGTDLISIRLADPPRNGTLAKVRPWDVAQAVFDSYDTELATALADTTPKFYLPEFVNVDPPMYLALGMLHKTNGSIAPPTTFTDESTLQKLATEYFQQHAALVASRALTERTESSTTGTAVLQRERVIVRFAVVQLMVALLAVAIILAILAAFLVPRKGFLPRDPSTLIDAATLIAHSRPLLQALRGAGGGSERVLRERLGGSDYFVGVESYDSPSSSKGEGYFRVFGSPAAQGATQEFVERTDKFPFPVALHPIVRVAAVILVAALAACLEIPLRMSQSNGGLGDAADETTYVYILWTAAPALVLLHFASYYASVDLTTRALAPYAALRRGESFDKSINLNYLDRATPLVLYESVKSRHVAVAAAGVALLTSSLLVAAVAPVFSVATVPAVLDVQLAGQDSFPQSGTTVDPGSCADCPRNGALMASLILNANVSYPAFTYEDLNFPTLAMGNALNGVMIPDDAIITVSLPAVRPAMSCKVFKQSEIVANLTFNGKSNPLQISLLGEEPQGDTGSTASTFILDTARPSAGEQGTTVPRDALFGTTGHRQIKHDDGTIVFHWVYAWGQLADANTATTTVSAISAMACNESVEQVDTKATFFGASLAIHPSNPPVVQSAVAPVTLATPLSSINFYDQLVNLSTPHLLDPFFASLVASRYAIPVNALGNSDADSPDKVADAIVRQHKIIRTQVLHEFSKASRISAQTGQQDASATAKANSQTATISGTLISGSLRSAAFKITSSTATTTDSSGNSSPAPLTARRRIVQDAVATRVLQGLLGGTALLGLVGWAALPRTNILPRTIGGSGGSLSIASTAALLVDGNLFGVLGRAAEWQATDRLRELFMDGLHVAMGFRLGWEAPKRRRREETLAAWGMNGASGGSKPEELFGIGAVRTGGWGGGEAVGLGLQARVGFGHRSHVRDWGWRT